MRNMGQRNEDEGAAAITRRESASIRTPRPDGSAAVIDKALRPRSAPEGAIERLCIEHGLKMTGQRRTIARVLSETSDHPDVEELYRRAVLLDAHISIATVYRTVRLFEEKGILHRRDFGSGRARYEPTEHGPHYHLIDVETGKVVEFTNAKHEKFVRDLAERLGFEVLSLRLEVFGKRRAEQPSSGSTEGLSKSETSR